MGLNKVKRSSEIRKSLTVLLSLIEPRWVRKVEADIKRQPRELGRDARVAILPERKKVYLLKAFKILPIYYARATLMSTKLKSGGSMSAIISP